jgi:hypothetical protein
LALTLPELPERLDDYLQGLLPDKVASIWGYFDARVSVATSYLHVLLIHLFPLLIFFLYFISAAWLKIASLPCKEESAAVHCKTWRWDCLAGARKRLAWSNTHWCD